MLERGRARHPRQGAAWQGAARHGAVRQGALRHGVAGRGLVWCVATTRDRAWAAVVVVREADRGVRRVVSGLRGVECAMNRSR
ncbi:hypothetical protein BKM31_04720 [[Actinomadura] parvosata subsp. kistnae]|uniref:Uncharacterized protein n=1 Tax=[Actinomadura] parvosata subsp. kistnae TaxID=1909395 RepID=A0A1U9ZSG0_9ACTN|nr:hypothetical protein BKM31_04720 [Nonomuraea sp. ATCC 55076]